MKSTVLGIALNVSLLISLLAQTLPQQSPSSRPAEDEVVRVTVGALTQSLVEKKGEPGWLSLQGFGFSKTRRSVSYRTELRAEPFQCR
jgi:hypothetical protein